MPDKRFQLLSYLAYKNDWVTREQASFLFWPDVPSQSARANLRHLLKRIRQFDWLAGLEVDRHRLRWHVDTDVAGLKQVATSAKPDAKWSEYRGPLLQDLDGDDAGEFATWLEMEREQLSSLWRGTVLKRARELTEQGRHREAAELYRRLLKQDELDEEALTAYMQAAFQAGDKEQALRRYHSFAERLKSELDLEPSTATEQLAKSIREASQHEPGLELETAKQAPAVATAVKEGKRLPTSPTTFIGRELELSEIADLLGKPDCRLLTLNGPGGVGKSHLALKAAEELWQTFSDGGCWVALESLTEASHIARAIAEGLKLRLAGDRDALEQIVHYLKGRELLLILDNFEHLLDGAPLVTRLLQECPRLKLLDTSREALNVQEEWRLPLEGLPLPTDSAVSIQEALTFDAVEVFVATGQRVNPRFTVSEENLADVVQICRLVGGLPLGIELAAAWVKMMPPAEIAGQLKDSLDFLTARTRNVAERHQSIKATFEHSWRLLTPSEQRVLRQLSVFRGGFRLDAARYVANASLPILANLVDKSLLRASGDDRYDRHPLLHEYTKEKLAEHPEEERQTQDKHLRYHVGLAEEAEPEVYGAARSTRWLDRLEEEHDNLRAALNHAEANEQAELGMRLGGALWLYWSERGPISEGRMYLTTMLSLDGADQPTQARARALFGAGVLARVQGDLASSRTLFEESLALSRKLGNDLIAASLFHLGRQAALQRDYPTARPLFEQALAIDRKLGRKWGIAASLGALGDLAVNQGDFSAARSSYEQSLAISREMGDKVGIASSLHKLGVVAYHQGDYARARSLYQQSLALGRQFGFKRLIAGSLYRLALVYHEQGEYAQARSLHAESLALSRELENRIAVAHSLEGMARLSAATSDGMRAARLWGAAEVMSGVQDTVVPPDERTRYQQEIAATRTQLGNGAFAAAWAEGQAMSLEEAADYAMTEV